MAIVRIDEKKKQIQHPFTDTKDGRCDIKFYCIVVYMNSALHTVNVKNSSNITVDELKPGVERTIQVHYSGTPDRWVPSGNRSIHRAHAVVKKILDKNKRDPNIKTKPAIKIYRLGSKKCPVIIVSSNAAKNKFPSEFKIMLK